MDFRNGRISVIWVSFPIGFEHAYGGDVVSVGVSVGGIGASVRVEVGVEVNVDVGGKGVDVYVEVGVGVMEGVHVGGMKLVGVMVGVPVWVGVLVNVGVMLGVSVFNTGVKERLKVDVGDIVNVAVNSDSVPSGATMIATSPTQ
jgi:hypothetical protein